MNEDITFGEKGIYINCNDLRDYSWDFTSDNSRISSFSKGIVSKTIPLIICCSSKEEGLKLKNRLLEICDKDVLAVRHGRLIIGDYYMKCFITGSKKDNYLIHKGYMETTLTVTTDFPAWIKESIIQFRPNNTTVEDDVAINTGKRNLDFNVDFLYDYTSDMTSKKLNNTGFVGTNFRMIIYGAAANPAVHISGHTYQVNGVIGEGEYLTIDSLQKTIILTKLDGTTENYFNKRNRESYIFEKIKPGNNTVVWGDTNGFDIILLEERSEPKWT